MDDFLFEIVVVSGLSHPNIVTFLGVSVGLLLSFLFVHLFVVVVLLFLLVHFFNYSNSLLIIIRCQNKRCWIGNRVDEKGEFG